MSTPAKCHGCGADVDGSALFCSRCGQDMTLVGDEQPTLAATTAGTPVQPVRSTMRQALRDATLGEYEILSELGRGGMATVFLAHDIALDRKVAIKVMAPHLLQGEGMAERFKLEARTAAQLSHPHIIPIYAVKETAETLFFVMKYVEGRALDAVIKKTGALPIHMVTDVLTKVGSALGYAHRRDVVHRDIKPGNVMIDEEGTPIVTDFGIAKVAETKGLTVTGTTIGTPSYMSPEQCEAKAVTGASDQYSLGIVAFEMLTGKLPFDGDSAVTTMYKHCHEALPSIEDFRPDCPAELRETITRMVAKKPEDRWPSMEAAVRRLSNEPTPTSVDPIRSQLLELVKEGDADQLLARLSDPAGPVAAGTGPRTATGAAAPARSRTGLLAAVGVVAVLAVGGTLAILQPWAGGVEAGEVGGAPTAQADPGDAAPVEPGSAIAAGPGGGATTPPPASVTGDAPSGGTPPAQATTPTPVADAPAATVATQPPPTAARAVVASVRISGPTEPLRPGGTASFAATPTDAQGGAVSGSTVQWSSSNERVARVDAGGNVTAVAPGQAVLTASAGSAAGTFTVTVAEIPVARLVLAASTLELTVGDERALGAEARDASGSTLAGRQVTWTSSDPEVARVSATGMVTATGPGTATVAATSGDASASASVTVRQDTRTAVEGLIAAYAQALESRDVSQVRAVYPGITSAREGQLRDALGSMEGLRVEYVIDSVDEQGSTAVAAVRATYRFRFDGRAQAQPVPLTFTFGRTATGWSVSSIQ